MEIPHQFRHAPNLYEELKRTIENWQHLGHFSLLEEVVLASGASYPTEAQPTDLGEIKMCYANAANLALGFRPQNRGMTYTYVEGFVRTPGLIMPIQHAWCLKDGVVYDNTLRKQDGAEYIGVEITESMLREELLRTEVYGLFDVGGMYNIEFLRKISPDTISRFEKYIEEQRMKRAL